MNDVYYTIVMSITGGEVCIIMHVNEGGLAKVQIIMFLLHNCC